MFYRQTTLLRLEDLVVVSKQRDVPSLTVVRSPSHIHLEGKFGFIIIQKLYHPNVFIWGKSKKLIHFNLYMLACSSVYVLHMFNSHCIVKNVFSPLVNKRYPMFPVNIFSSIYQPSCELLPVVVVVNLYNYS